MEKMIESDYKRLITNALTAMGWDIQWHEDAFVKYIPDISFGAHGIDGWIEVKFKQDPPKRIGDIKHYTKGQEDWLRKRGAVGAGRCYVVLGTGVGHLALPHTSLSNARTATYIAAQSLPGALWAPGPPEFVAGFCQQLDHRIRRT
jgi:hypothetical protein